MLSHAVCLLSLVFYFLFLIPVKSTRREIYRTPVHLQVQLQIHGDQADLTESPLLKRMIFLVYYFCYWIWLTTQPLETSSSLIWL